MVRLKGSCQATPHSQSLQRPLEGCRIMPESTDACPEGEKVQGREASENFQCLGRWAKANTGCWSMDGLWTSSAQGRKDTLPSPTVGLWVPGQSGPTVTPRGIRNLDKSIPISLDITSPLTSKTRTRHRATVSLALNEILPVGCGPLLCGREALYVCNIRCSNPKFQLVY